MTRRTDPPPAATGAFAIPPLGAGPPDCRANLFGGRGLVRVWSLLGAPAAPFTAVLSCELEAGASVGRHQQEDFAEIVVGLGGTGVATVNDTTHALGPGDVVHLPLGAVLSIANRSADAPLWYLIIKARG